MLLGYLIFRITSDSLGYVGTEMLDEGCYLLGIPFGSSLVRPISRIAHNALAQALG